MSLKAYDSYRKSNLGWLDEVPDHWENKKIAWDLPYVVGWTPPSGKDEFYDGEHPWVTIADMTRGNIEDTQSKITDAAIDAKKAEIVPAGSMLFSFKLSVGKVAFLKIDSYTNEAIAAFRPTNGISLEFWKYAAPEIIPHYGRENIYGAKLLNQELIGSARFYCPPVIEQTQIARFLDHETAKIDALIREQERLIELLQEKRQAVISHAVTKGLDPNVPMKDSGVEWLGEVPAHWEVLPFRRGINFLTDYEANGSFAATKNIVKLDEGAPYAWFVRATDLANGRIGLVEGNRFCDESSYSFLKKTQLKGGELLVAKRGEVGKVYAMPDVDCPATLAPNLYSIRFEKNLETKFSFYWLSSSYGNPQLRLANKSTTIGALYKDDVRALAFVFPPVQEQRSISTFLDDQCAELDRLIEAVGASQDLLTERRSALISAAVTGKIDVRNWQPPTDESAFNEEVRAIGMEATA